MNIEYNSSYGKFSSQEWRSMINNALKTIKKTELGNLLVSEINKQCRKPGINVTICSNPRYPTSYHYPKITYHGGKNDIHIIIPPYPYISKVETIEKEMLPSYLIEDCDDIIIKYLSSICNGIDVSKKIIKSPEILNNSNKTIKKIDPFRVYEIQKFEVILMHEMIHALRYIMNVNSSEVEEEGTIFGVEGNTLTIDGKRITENTIRSEMGLNMRINHNGIIIKNK